MKNNTHLPIKALSPRMEAGTILNSKSNTPNEKEVADKMISILLKAGYSYSEMPRIFRLARVQFDELKKREAMNKKKIYIGGKVTGEDYDKCFLKFKAIQDTLEAVGFEVFNPMKIVSKGTSWTKAMKICLDTLKECDVLFLLPDWKKSEGAKSEFFFANENNIKVLFYHQINELQWVS